jgi:hypothetical protein
MKLLQILMLASLCLVLPQCAALTKSVKVTPAAPPQIARPSDELLKKCNLPVDLGEGPLAQERLEKLWITDRSSLIKCYRRNLALVDFILDRDGRLTAVPIARPH